MKTLSCSLSGLVRRWVGLVAVAAALGGLSGCASTGQPHPSDPLEGFNRAMFSFNDGVDTVALKPAATVYKTVLPSFVQTGVGNFFGNLADVWSSINNFLQGKGEDGLTDMMRVAVNSTLGLGGLLDIGSEAGLPKHKEDFGQTLGKWGVGSGPYVVLPLFGPSTLRDSAALPVDLLGDPWSYAEPAQVFNVGSVVRVVDLRAAALEAGDLVEDAALDRYAFIRDAFLQRRQSKVYDGNPPPKTGSLTPATSAEAVVAADSGPDSNASNVSDTIAPATAMVGPELPAAPLVVAVADATAPATPASSSFKLDQSSPANSAEAGKIGNETAHRAVPAVAEKATKPALSAQTGEK